MPQDETLSSYSLCYCFVKSHKNIHTQHNTVKILQTVNLLPWSCTGNYTVDQCGETTLILFRPLCLLNGDI